MLIINDLHIGVVRSGGTTPQSQEALRICLRRGLKDILWEEDYEAVINGDLFDSFTVDTLEVVKTAEILYEWLYNRASGKLHLIAGNHDWNPRAGKLSSFHLLAIMLDMSDVGGRVQIYDKGFSRISDEGIWCIPHQANQEVFDAEIEKAINQPKPTVKGEDRFLLLHCNYRNNFADNSDHSLNLSEEQVANLMISGWSLVIGHEHIGYSLRGGRVLVVGNQFPSSVADCKGEKGKFAVKITDEGVVPIQTWSPNGHYTEIDWRSECPERYHFIRVVGDATAQEAAEVIKAVANMRQRSDAFVITNAVRIEGQDMTVCEESVESIRAFDVVGAIMAELDECEQEVVKGLLNAQ